jgi:hypothetical protein
MQYQSMEQIAANANILALALSRRARLERWADLLERQPELLRPIPGVEFGPRPERDARRADGSPLTVAFADPVLRSGGLQGDRIGDAAEFFGLSHRQLHLLVCSCHHGETVEPSTTAEYIRTLARRPEAPVRAALATGLAVGAGLAATVGLVALL